MSLSSMNTNIRAVVTEAHKRTFSTKGDFARRHADFVAVAASMQLITTRMTADVYSREWRPTSLGLMYLDQVELVDA